MVKKALLNLRISEGLNILFGDKYFNDKSKIEEAKDRLNVVGWLKFNSFQELDFGNDKSVRELIQKFIKDNYKKRKSNPSFSAFVAAINILYTIEDANEIDYTKEIVKEAKKIGSKHYGSDFDVVYKSAEELIENCKKVTGYRKNEEEIEKKLAPIMETLGALASKEPAYLADLNVAIPEKILDLLIIDTTNRTDIYLINTDDMKLCMARVYLNEEIDPNNKLLERSFWYRFENEIDIMVKERNAATKNKLEKEIDINSIINSTENQIDQRAHEEIVAGMLDWVGKKVFKSDFGLKERVEKIYDKEAIKVFEPYRIPLQKIGYPVEKIEAFISKGASAQDVKEMCNDIISKSTSKSEDSEIISNAKKDINKIKERVDVFIYLAELKNNLEEKIGSEKTREVLSTLDRWMVENKII